LLWSPRSGDPVAGVSGDPLEGEAVGEGETELAPIAHRHHDGAEVGKRHDQDVGGVVAPRQAGPDELDLAHGQSQDAIAL
jgi:hypothetical protein